ncbi:MAG TPA: hypothetical protein VFW33_07830, partial [Gemmataceae bacterium]|nr:hypothetical protein [Gemmataceae bacterium]
MNTVATYNGLVRVADFPADALTLVHEPTVSGDRPLAAVMLRAVPEDHPLRDLPEYHVGGLRDQAAVALGPPALSLKPRHFYFLRCSRRWATLVNQAQLARLSNVPVAALTDDQLARLRRREQLGGRFPPKPTPLPPSPRRPERPWFEDCAEALRSLPKITSVSLWTTPPAGTTLADLLRVRDLFVGEQADGYDLEDDAEPLKYAAHRFSARVAGEARREQLLDSLSILLRGLDRAIEEQLGKGQRWAALRHEAIEAALMALADRVAALEKKRSRP